MCDRETNSRFWRGWRSLKNKRVGVSSTLPEVRYSFTLFDSVLKCHKKSKRKGNKNILPNHIRTLKFDAPVGHNNGSSFGLGKARSELLRMR